jgi:hypothetical protein
MVDENVSSDDRHDDRPKNTPAKRVIVLLCGVNSLEFLLVASLWRDEWI